MMTTARNEKTLHDLFLISMWIKGLVGVIQAVGGALLLTVSHHALTAFVMSMTTPELSEDPHDLIATFLTRSAAHFSGGTQLFASVYLISHGAIKILLVVALLRNKLWSYPVSLWVLCAFIVYQCYRYTHTHSPWLVMLTALDVVVLFLIFHEYRVRKALSVT